MARKTLWLLPVLLVAGACTQDQDTGDTVPASEGARQPAGDGTPMEAVEACAAIVAAEADARDRLGCDPVEVSCPDYVLPAGSAACVAIDAGSVDACVARVEEYSSCSDWSRKPCLLTTIPTDGCAAGGAGGSSGTPGGAAGSVAGGAAGGSSVAGGAGGTSGGAMAGGAMPGGATSAGGVAGAGGR